MATHMKAVFEGMYEAGFKGLKQHLEAQSWRSADVIVHRSLRPCPLYAAAAMMQQSLPESDLDDSASTGSCCSRSGTKV